MQYLFSKRSEQISFKNFKLERNSFSPIKLLISVKLKSHQRYETNRTNCPSSSWSSETGKFCWSYLTSPIDADIVHLILIKNWFFFFFALPFVFIYCPFTQNPSKVHFSITKRHLNSLSTILSDNIYISCCPEGNKKWKREKALAWGIFQKYYTYYISYINIF